MSLATLPADLYDKITSHLVGDQVRGKKRPIALGKAISLVCKVLRPVGQALVWRFVTFDYAKFAESLPEVFASFEAYPHLHSLIKYIHTDNEETPSAAGFARISSILLNILPHCRDLESLEISFPEHASRSLVRSIFDVGSRFEKLEQLNLLGAPLVLNPDMIKTLHIGFPELDSLYLTITVPPGGCKQLELAEPKDTRSGFLRRLTLAVDEIEPQQIVRLQLILLRAVGAFRLSHCTFYGKLFHGATFEWLTLECVHVRNMEYLCGPSELAEGMIDLIYSLPHMDHILSLSINQFLNHEQQNYHGQKSPWSLARFLSAIPPSMLLLLLKGIYFFGSLSWPETRRKPSELALITGPSIKFYLKTSRSSPQIFITLKKMKDSRGVPRWYRVMET